MFSHNSTTTAITHTATGGRSIHPHTHPAEFHPEQPPYAEMGPTVSVSIEAGLAPIMEALQDGFTPLRYSV